MSGKAEKQEAEAVEEEPRALTPEERRRNVQRVVDSEAELARVEAALANAVFEGARAMRRLRVARDELRGVLGQEPIGSLAPLYESLADRKADPPDDER